MQALWVEFICAAQRQVKELERLSSCTDYTLPPVSKTEALRVRQHDALNDAMRNRGVMSSQREAQA